MSGDTPAKNKLLQRNHKYAPRCEGIVCEKRANPPDSPYCTRANHSGVGPKRGRTQQTLLPRKYHTDFGCFMMRLCDKLTLSYQEVLLVRCPFFDIIADQQHLPQKIFRVRTDPSIFTNSMFSMYRGIHQICI